MSAANATGAAFGADGPAAGRAQPRSASDAEWEAMDPPASSDAAPMLSVDGFEGPLDWLVEMARTRKLDLSQFSILALVEAFAAALDAALDRRVQQGVADLARWADWTVLATQLTLLRSQMLLPPGSPEAQRAQDAAAALRRDFAGRAAIQAAADWLERRPQLGRDGRRSAAEPSVRSCPRRRCPGCSAAGPPACRMREHPAGPHAWSPGRVPGRELGRSRTPPATPRPSHPAWHPPVHPRVWRAGRVHTLSPTKISVRPGNQRLVCRIAWRAQAVRVLCRLPLAWLHRAEGARMVRNGSPSAGIPAATRPEP